MNNSDQHDTGAEIHMPVYNTTQEDSQLTESGFSHNRIFTACGFPTDGQRYCTDDYDLEQNIKVEADEVEVKQEDDVCSGQMCNVDAHLKTDVETVNRAEDEIKDQEDILQFQDTFQDKGQLSRWTHCVNEPFIVKQETTDSDECGKDGAETRRWVVCQADILKEVKVEHTQSVKAEHTQSVKAEHTQSVKAEHTQSVKAEHTQSVKAEHTQSVKADHTRSVSGEACSEHVDQTQQRNSRKILRTLLLKKCVLVSASEVIQTGEKPYLCKICGKSFTRLRSMKDHATIHTGEKPYICETCGKSFRRLRYMKIHTTIHTGTKPYICETCGKSFVSSNGLKYHETTHLRYTWKIL